MTITNNAIISKLREMHYSGYTEEEIYSVIDSIPNDVSDINLILLKVERRKRYYSRVKEIMNSMFVEDRANRFTWGNGELRIL